MFVPHLTVCGLLRLVFGVPTGLGGVTMHSNRFHYAVRLRIRVCCGLIGRILVCAAFLAADHGCCQCR
jgi:hypothetical protein